jgi:hypothetical protein
MTVTNLPVEHKHLRAPSGLGKGGRRLWRAIANPGTYELRPDEVRVLEDACREVDLIDRLEDALAGEPLTVAGSQGQIVVHPLIVEVR